MFSREGAIECPIFIGLVDITGRVSIGREAYGEEARDKEKTLGEAPGLRWRERAPALGDATLHFTGSAFRARELASGSR